MKARSCCVPDPVLRLFLCLGLGSVPVLAQVVPAGPEFQVNTFTTNAQGYSTLGPDGAGGFVVVWHSFGSVGTDSDAFSIQGQRFGSDGLPLGGQFQVNTVTTGIQLRPEVGPDGAGGFVVVWDINSGIQGQRYSSDGSPRGSQFRVDSGISNNQLRSVVGPDGDGGFVVAWDSFASLETDSDGFSIQAQRFNSAGSPLGGQFQVNSYTTSFQIRPSIGPDAAGGFVILWDSNGSAGTDTSFQSVQGQRFRPNGSPRGGQFQVNSYTLGVQNAAKLSADGAGGLVVVWSSAGSVGSDSSSYSIQGQRYDTNGSTLGLQFQINAYTTNRQADPAVSLDGTGGFIVAWHSSESAGTDRTISIQAQSFSSSGAPIGDQFQVNAYTTGTQSGANVVPDAAGSFVVAWDSIGSAGTDQSYTSIQLLRFQAATPTFPPVELQGARDETRAGLALGLLALGLLALGPRRGKSRR